MLCADAVDDDADEARLEVEGAGDEVVISKVGVAISALVVLVAWVSCSLERSKGGRGWAERAKSRSEAARKAEVERPAPFAPSRLEG